MHLTEGYGDLKVVSVKSQSQEETKQERER